VRLALAQTRKFRLSLFLLQAAAEEELKNLVEEAQAVVW
jgi:hypothetical protein